MKSFLKSTAAVITGNIILLLFVLVIALIIIKAVTKKEEVVFESNSVLLLDFDYTIPEQTPDNPFAEFAAIFGEDEFNNHLGLRDIIENIEKAKEDPKIKGIFLDFQFMPNGMGTTESLRAALIDFKESDKFIIGYGEMYSQKAYYLASVADELYVNPTGGMDMRGLGAQLMFMKGTLDKLDITIDTFYQGDFKSAFEPLVRTSMSDSNRLAMKVILDGLWGHMTSEIESSVGVTTAELNNIADNMLAASGAIEAASLGLITDAFYYDEVLGRIRDQLGIDSDDEINFVKIGEYNEIELGTKKEKKKKKKNPPKDKIALVYAVGGIVDGKGEQNQIGSERYAKTIRDLREDEDIDAIVLRVNSGGGSALASEIIWRELELAQAEKPVIVSFGDVAASGGYYIACGSDYIFAEPTTITGSIGVFGLIPQMGEFFENKLGITFDEVGTNEHSIFGGGVKPLSEEERALISSEIGEIYELFTSRVAEGRDLPIETVKKYAKGRIWTGEQALDYGLVDELGGLNLAIEKAASEADIEKYKVIEFPESEFNPDMIFSSMFANMRNAEIEMLLGSEVDIVEAITEIRQMTGIQARMPFTIQFH